MQQGPPDAVGLEFYQLRIAPQHTDCLVLVAGFESGPKRGCRLRPNRFKYVLTPTHGSWLNIVETLFGKMTRTFLRRIRVKSKDELKERILRGIAKINAMPVVHRWKAFEALEAAAETV